MLALRLGIVVVLYLFVLWAVRSLWADLFSPAPAMAPLSTARVVTLTTTGGDATAFPLRSVTTIGRAQDNAIALASEFVSGHHAVLRLQKDGWWLQDLGSTNGTWVNDRRVTQLILVHTGDVIRFGSLVARFEG
jgi:hypothetical protein